MRKTIFGALASLWVWTVGAVTRAMGSERLPHHVQPVREVEPSSLADLGLTQTPSGTEPSECPLSSVEPLDASLLPQSLSSGVISKYVTRDSAGTFWLITVQLDGHMVMRTYYGSVEFTRGLGPDPLDDMRGTYTYSPMD